ncbi:MAG: DUF481 domain-containing protein [Fimbriiglobus sp.]
MRGRNWAATALTGVFVVAAVAAGQAPPTPTPYFGTPLNENFTATTAFPNPPPAPTELPPPPPVLKTPPPVAPFRPEAVIFPPRDPAPTPTPTPIEILAPDPEAPPPAPKLWHGSLDAGVNGATGNTDLVNIRTTFNAQRQTPGNLFVTDFLYTYTWQDGDISQQQAIFNARDEVLFPGEPWSLFSASQVEYDQLRAYRFRVGVYGGTGYAVADSKELLFRLRAGVGAQREIGSEGNRNQWVPEAVFGYDFRYRIDDRNALVSVLDFYPRLNDWSMYRVRARAAYELVIDPKRGTVLRFGIQDRYDSNPGNAKRNDINYFTTLGVRF